MDLDPMSGAVNADFVKANITTKKNASILVDTATSVAAIRALSVVEEDLKEKTGTTILDRTKDTETKIKNSGDQRVMTKPTRKQVREKEHQVKHWEFRLTTMGGTAPPTQARMIIIGGATASHLTMTGGTSTRELGRAEWGQIDQTPQEGGICSANIPHYLTLWGWPHSISSIRGTLLGLETNLQREHATE